jgi:hypothetical protein
MGYSVEIDSVERQDWDRFLSGFDDANVFQTWAYGSSRWGEKNLSRAVVKSNGVVVGLVQLVIFKVPILGQILGYAIFGPVWQRCDGARDIDHYRAVIRALEQEYVVQRGLNLRLRPWQLDPSHEIRDAMKAETDWQETKPLYSTYILDLSPPLADLHKHLDRKWRANLRKADTHGLRVTEHRGTGAIELFSELSRQTQRRKGYTSQFMDMFQSFYPALPESFKPRIIVCDRDGQPVAAVIISIAGNRAFYLNGATSNSGLAVRAGHYLQWHVVCLLKEMEPVRWYDLYGGLENPGVRRFKRGIIGAKAIETPMPEFQATGNAYSAWLLDCAMSLREAQAYLNRQLATFRGPRGSTGPA